MREDVLVGIKPINQRSSAEGCANSLIEALRRPVSDPDFSGPAAEPRGVARADGEAEMLKHRSIDSTHLVLGVFAMNGKAAATPDHQGIGYEA